MPPLLLLLPALAAAAAAVAARAPQPASCGAAAGLALSSGGGRLEVALDDSTGAYVVCLDGAPWLRSAGTTYGSGTAQLLSVSSLTRPLMVT